MLEPGDMVIVKDPGSLLAEIRKKIGNGRVGIVETVSARGDGLYVKFPKEGRKKEYRQWFSSAGFLIRVDEATTPQTLPEGA